MLFFWLRLTASAQETLLEPSIAGAGLFLLFLFDLCADGLYFLIDLVDLFVLLLLVLDVAGVDFGVVFGAVLLGLVVLDGLDFVGEVVERGHFVVTHDIEYLNMSYNNNELMVGVQTAMMLNTFVLLIP